MPWHRHLEARVALALGLLVAVALGGVLVATLRVVSSQSRDRVAADLEVARTTFDQLLDRRLMTSIDVATLVAGASASRHPLIGDRATRSALAASLRQELKADFAILTGDEDTWVGTDGWDDRAGSGVAAVRTAQTLAGRGQASGALVPLDGALHFAVSVPLLERGAGSGTLTAGYRLTDAIARDLAGLARCEVALVVHGRVVATSLHEHLAQLDDVVVRATMAPQGVLPDVVNVGQRQFVGGVFALEPDLPGGDAVRLLVLSDWAATQLFIDTLEMRFAAAGAVALLLSLAGGVYLSRHLSRPLSDIASAATEIAAGNLSLQLPVRGTAEAATVARALNAMSVSLRSAHERLVHDAIHDHLTQLPNRSHFKDRLDRALARRARRKDYQFAVLFVDLDRFKHVNDSLGHSAGDRLLILFAERLAAAVRAEDVVTRMPGAARLPEPTLARFGGDEFAVLLDGIGEPVDAVRVAKRVQAMAAEPLHLDGQEVFASASIGVAVATDLHTSGDDIIRDADLAMYRAKDAGAGNYSVFDHVLHDEAVRRLRLETDLRHAIERDEFRVFFQPIVALDDHRVVGAEALVRWQHPDRGLLLPGEFFEVADDVGLIAGIDEWVLEEACRQAGTWLRNGTVAPGFTISTNLSAKAFAQETLVKRVADILHATGYPAAALRLEITEGAAIKDAVRARLVLAELRATGIRISLDDFGTGYSSLSYLQSLPLDLLKIDRSFVAGIGTDKDKGEIVKLIVGLARTLRLDIVAEGTETAAQVAHLLALGCPFGQGYFFARPGAAIDGGPPMVAVPAPSPSVGRPRLTASSLASRG